MWHGATCLVEVKRTRFPALVAKPCALCSEWCLASRPSVMVEVQGRPVQTALSERQRGSLHRSKNGPWILAAQMSAGWEKPHVGGTVF